MPLAVLRSSRSRVPWRPARVWFSSPPSTTPAAIRRLCCAGRHSDGAQTGLTPPDGLRQFSLISGLISPIAAAPNPGQRIILPDSKLIGCKASTCSQVMPDPIAASHAVYPSLVLVDITDGAIIGLIARYDPS